MIRILQVWIRGLSHYGRGYARANQLGLRLLGVVYFAAFASYAVQADGLVGERGILPFAAWLGAIRPRVEEIGFHQVPTILWLAPSDAALRICLWTGMALAVMLASGFLPLIAAAGLWVLYLSATTVGQIFWNYQWDNLLLEAGFLAIFAAPWRVRMRWLAPDEPPRIIVLLFHWLMFRLMFLSGYVKWASGDEAWRNLTALTYHYWTQPLPLPTAWYVHQLPIWFHKLSCALVFVVELVCPFLIWFGDRARMVAAISFIALMALIAATGNYTFFNLLAAVLSLWLIRDQIGAALLSRVPGRFGRWLARAFRREAPSPEWRPLRVARHAAAAVAAAFVLVTSGVLFVAAVGGGADWPRWIESLVRFTAPFRSVNNYGLFAVMTKTRPEIILEGTWDGQLWIPYEFRWKPGEPDMRPRLAAPHQPRLDWQMWFAALGKLEGNRWLINLMIRLLENEPDVLRLLAFNPFEQRPPVAIRAVRYEYRFATPAERSQGKVWWMRKYKDLYCPPIQIHP